MRLPIWLRKSTRTGDRTHELKKGLRRYGLHTVCEEAHCPNQEECFSHGTATFMIMGNVCTRHCGFCAVKNGNPKPPDPDEPLHIAEQVRDLRLFHAVVTSVTRDDLTDGGAHHFAETINAIRECCPATTIEVLTPDFDGKHESSKIVCDARPHIFNHNVETVERLTPRVRNKASYRKSLDVLRMARTFLPLCKREVGEVTSRGCHPEPKAKDPAGFFAEFTLSEVEGLRMTSSMSPNLTSPYKGGGLIKSGLMVGLGESEKEVVATLHDLKDVGCDIVTIGQYLRPSKTAISVAEYIHPDQFKKYQLLGEEIGIKYMFCGPFVRSSYRAEEIKVIF